MVTTNGYDTFSSRQLVLGLTTTTRSLSQARRESMAARFFISATVYEGICYMLNADDEKERDELTQKWLTHKLQELKFAGTVVCTVLLAPFLA